MASFHIKKGRDINLKGAASIEIVDFPLPKTVAIQPGDFKGLLPRLVVKEGDAVKAGSPLIVDKKIEGLQIVSPASGTVKAINRGAKRLLLEIIIETDGLQTAEQGSKYSLEQINALSRDQIITQLLQGGLWPTLRQRPFSCIANPQDTPKSIFIHAMNTEPLALNVDVVLKDHEKFFATGVDILKKLTDGKVHLATSVKAQCKALTDTQGVEIHQFSGPHPAGNVSTHIHHVDPINKGDIVWVIEAQDVLRVASLLIEGQHPTERVVALTGEGCSKRVYAKTCIGASLESLLDGTQSEGLRYLSGSVLAGKDVGRQGFVRFYDSQITVLPTGGQRELLGWMVPGFKKYTFSHTYASAFIPKQEQSLTTDLYGSDRAMVCNHIYDDYVALDIMTYFLLKAVISEDIEEAEKLGILECDPEDFALATFACPSKTDVGAIIEQGLITIQQEG